MPQYRNSSLISCSKEEPVNCGAGSSKSVLTNGLLVMNEGLFQHNNAKLSWVDLSNDEVISFFENKNQRPLGDTGNDVRNMDQKSMPLSMFLVQ